MAGYRSAAEAPFHTQWEPSSRYPLPDPGSAPNNCGPTSVVNIAHFYRDQWFGVYDTRRLATWDNYRGTSVGEQRTMLEKRGVPAIFTQPTLAAIKGLIRTGRHPIVLGMNYSTVPYDVAGHPFRGWHAVVALQNSLGGMLIRDPNFSNLPGRVDRTGGMRHYPDWVIQSAFVNARGWALIPENEKVVRSWYGRIRLRETRVVRESAREDVDNIFARAREDGFTYRRRDNEQLWANSYQYYWDGEITNGFFIVKTHSGDRKAIKREAGVIERQA